MERKTYNLFDIIYSGTAKYLERAEKDVNSPKTFITLY